jgi:ubiquinone biosynthesis protein UbiJ
MVLEASILAQDALAVPGASRGLFGPSTRSSHLSDFVREAEGTLSYALASVDDVPLAWHSATAQSFKSTDLADTADFVQKLLWNLAQDVVLDGGDVAARVLGDVLSRQLRQSGAGEKEAEAWLAFGMSQAERSEHTVVNSITDASSAIGSRSDIGCEAIAARHEIVRDGAEPARFRRDNHPRQICQL